MRVVRITFRENPNADDSAMTAAAVGAPKLPQTVEEEEPETPGSEMTSDEEVYCYCQHTCDFRHWLGSLTGTVHFAPIFATAALTHFST